MEETTHYSRILVRKVHESKCRSKDNIKMRLTEKGYEVKDGS